MKKRSILKFAAVLAFALAAMPGCKKERWLRTYRNGVFEDSINVTGWEVNEDVVRLGDFYYPWQGEDSIYFREGSHYFVEECYPFVPPPYYLLEVNGKIVGLRTNPISSVPDSSEIITIIYDPWVNDDTIHYEPSVINRFPNLVGVTIGDIYIRIVDVPIHDYFYIIDGEFYHRLDTVPRSFPTVEGWISGGLSYSDLVKRFPVPYYEDYKPPPVTIGIEFLLDSAGNVDSMIIWGWNSTGSPEWDSLILSSFSKWKFKPPEEVAVWRSISFEIYLK